MNLRWQQVGLDGLKRDMNDPRPRNLWRRASYRFHLWLADGDSPVEFTRFYLRRWLGHDKATGPVCWGMCQHPLPYGICAGAHSQDASSPPCTGTCAGCGSCALGPFAIPNGMLVLCGLCDPVKVAASLD